MLVEIDCGLLTQKMIYIGGESHIIIQFNLTPALFLHLTNCCCTKKVGICLEEFHVYLFMGFLGEEVSALS